MIARELESRGGNAPGSSILADTAIGTRLERIYQGLSAWGLVLDGEFDYLADLVAGLVLADLTDVADALAPVSGDVLQFDGSQWTAAAVSGIGGSISHATLLNLTAPADDHTQYHTDARALTWLNTKGINELSDVVISAAADDRFLRHNGTNWVDEAVAVYLKTGDTGTGVHDFGGATSLEIPNGAGGTTVDATGEVCVDSTSKTLNFFDGTSERTLNPEDSKSVTIETPTLNDSISVFFTNKAITITKMVAVLVGSATPSVAWTVRHSTDRSATGNEVVTGGTTTTSVSTGSVVTSFNDATVPADSFVWVVVGTVTGTVGQIHLTVFYNGDA